MNEDLLLLQEFIPIVKSLIKTHDVARWLLATDGFVFSLLLCAFLKQVSVTSEVFEDLSVLCQMKEGHEAVFMAFDSLMIYAKEQIRFQSTVSLLTSATDATVATDILVFFNIFLGKMSSISQRMAVLLSPFCHVGVQRFAFPRLPQCEGCSNEALQLRCERDRVHLWSAFPVPP